MAASGLTPESNTNGYSNRKVWYFNSICFTNISLYLSITICWTNYLNVLHMMMTLTVEVVLLFHSQRTSHWLSTGSTSLTWQTLPWRWKSPSTTSTNSPSTTSCSESVSICGYMRVCVCKPVQACVCSCFHVDSLQVWIRGEFWLEWSELVNLTMTSGATQWMWPAEWSLLEWWETSR